MTIDSAKRYINCKLAHLSINKCGELDNLVLDSAVFVIIMSWPSAANNYMIFHDRKSKVHLASNQSFLVYE